MQRANIQAEHMNVNHETKDVSPIASLVHYAHYRWTHCISYAEAAKARRVCLLHYLPAGRRSLNRGEFDYLENVSYQYCLASL